MRMLLGALCATLLSAGTCAAQEPSPTLPASPIAYTALEEQESLSDRVIYSQADPRWSGVRIGRRSIQEIGCLATVYAMVSTIAGRPLTPDELVRAFKGSRMVFGNLLGRDISQVLPLRIMSAIMVGTRSDIPAIVAREIRQKRFVLLKLDRDPGPKMREHWVYAAGITGNDIVIRDPDGGTELLLQDRYRLASVREIRVLERV